MEAQVGANSASAGKTQAPIPFHQLHRGRVPQWSCAASSSTPEKDSEPCSLFPEGFFCTQASPKQQTASPKLNLSHSEASVCAGDDPPFSCSLNSENHPHHVFCSPGPLEKAFKVSAPWAPALGRASSQSKGDCGSPSLSAEQPPTSSSRLGVSSQASCSSEGTYAKLGGLYT